MAYFTHTQCFSQNNQNTTQNLQNYTLSQNYTQTKDLISQDYNRDLIQEDYNQYRNQQNSNQLGEHEPFYCVQSQIIINNIDQQQYLVQKFIVNDQRLFLTSISFHQIMSMRYTTLLHIQNIERIDDHHYNLYSKPFFQFSDYIQTIHIWEFVDSTIKMDKNYKITQNQLIQYSDGSIHINFPSSYSFPSSTPLSALIKKLQEIANNPYEIKSTTMLIKAFEEKDMSILNQIVSTDLYVQLIQQNFMYLLTKQNRMQKKPNQF